MEYWATRGLEVEVTLLKGELPQPAKRSANRAKLGAAASSLLPSCIRSPKGLPARSRDRVCVSRREPGRKVAAVWVRSTDGELNHNHLTDILTEDAGFDHFRQVASLAGMDSRRQRMRKVVPQHWKCDPPCSPLGTTGLFILFYCRSSTMAVLS